MLLICMFRRHFIPELVSEYTVQKEPLLSGVPYCSGDQITLSLDLMTQIKNGSNLIMTYVIIPVWQELFDHNSTLAIEQMIRD